MKLLFWMMCTLSLGVSQGLNYVYDHVYNMLNSVDFAFTVPQIDSATPVPLHVALALHRVVKMDVDNLELVADGVLSMRWNDYRLSWDLWISSNTVNTIVWPNANRFWTPDIVLLNGIGSEYDTGFEASSMRIDHLGTVNWSRRLRMRIPCAPKGSSASSSISCSVSVGSWAHDSHRLSLQTSSDGIDLSQYWGQSPYQVSNVGVTHSSHNSTCCLAPFDVITFTVEVRA